MNIKQKTIGQVVFDISDTGYVYRHDYIDGQGRRIKGKEIKPILNTSGYLHFVHGYKHNGKQVRHMYFIHRLIAELFVYNPNPNKYNIVDHIDGNKLNNDPSNLRWTDQKGNLNNPNTKNNNRKALKEYWSKQENRQKMSETIKKLYSDPEVRAHMKHPRSEEARKRLRMSDKIWVHKDSERKFIYKEELQSYLDKGYIKGMGKIHTDKFKQDQSKRQKEYLKKLTPEEEASRRKKISKSISKLYAEGAKMGGRSRCS